MVYCRRFNLCWELYWLLIGAICALWFDSSRRRGSSGSRTQQRGSGLRQVYDLRCVQRGRPQGTSELLFLHFFISLFLSLFLSYWRSKNTPKVHVNHETRWMGSSLVSWPDLKGRWPKVWIPVRLSESFRLQMLCLHIVLAKQILWNLSDNVVPKILCLWPDFITTFIGHCFFNIGYISIYIWKK